MTALQDRTQEENEKKNVFEVPSVGSACRCARWACMKNSDHTESLETHSGRLLVSFTGQNFDWLRDRALTK